MDQLAQLIELWNKKHSRAFFEYISSHSIKHKHSKELNRFVVDFELDFDSPEKHLLAFYMKEQRQKIWLTEKQQWITQ